MDAAARSDASEVGGAMSEMSNASWILHRLVQEQGFHNLHRAPKHRDSQLGAVNRATRVLYSHFESAVAGSLSADSTTRKDALKMMSRLLRMVMRALDVLVGSTEEAAWWIERSLNLLVRPGIPVSVSVCGARMCRKIVSICGDRIFDVKIELRRLDSQSEWISLGRDLPRVLIERAGKLAALLPSSDEEDNEQYCTLVLLNEDASSKIGVAIEKVTEPDVSYLSMQLEKPESDERPTVPEPDATANAIIVHSSVRCDGCDMSPLRGYRFKCFSCPNYDLCSECYTGEKHDMDHEFIRLSDSSSGMGDVLQPRSKGGGTVPESSLVGSKHWKGSIVKAEVTSKGYALYRSGSFADCLATAKELAEVGCLVTVVRAVELNEIDRVFCWESQLATSIEPGLARSSRRSAPAQKSTMQKGERSTIRSMNSAIVKHRGEVYTRRMEDVLALASEVIAAVRSTLEGDGNTRQWRKSTSQALERALDNACELLELTTLKGRECHQRYFEAIGAANVLGGFIEPLRVGGFVARTGGSKAESGIFGSICSYALGNSTLRVYANLLSPCQEDPVKPGVMEMTVADVKAVSEISLGTGVIKSLEHLAPSFCSVIKRIHEWLMSSKTDGSAQDCLYRSELACAFMRSFSCMAPSWGSLFDNQIISVSPYCHAVHTWRPALIVLTTASLPVDARKHCRASVSIGAALSGRRRARKCREPARDHVANGVDLCPEAPVFVGDAADQAKIVLRSRQCRLHFPPAKLRR